MGRPRKNRVGEYAAALGEELSYHLQREVARAVEESQKVYLEEIASLRQEIRGLSQRVEALSKKSKGSRSRVGRWVPGGPGRPPKDAEDRIAAFEARTSRSKKTSTTKKKKSMSCCRLARSISSTTLTGSRVRTWLPSRTGYVQ